MQSFLFGIFVILHGLVHLWYLTLSQGLVELKPEMGWTGKSWFFTPRLGDSKSRRIASVLYALSAIAFAVSGIGIFMQAAWQRPILFGAAMISALTIFLEWDGSKQRIIEKGLIGLLISLGILIALFLQ